MAKPKTTPTLTRKFDPDAMDRFIDAVDNPRDRAILEVLAWTGMRGGELRAFSCDWIRWDELRIYIPHDLTFSPKGREPRSIPILERLEKVLREWLGERRDGLVFPPLRRGSSGGGVARGPRLRDVMKRAREKSGVDIRGAHDLRHHFISWLSYVGRPPREVQEIAGHKDGATTQRYTHVSPTYLADAREALNRALRERQVATEVATGAKMEGPKKPSKIGRRS